MIVGLSPLHKEKRKDLRTLLLQKRQGRERERDERLCGQGSRRKSVYITEIQARQAHGNGCCNSILVPCCFPDTLLRHKDDRVSCIFSEPKDKRDFADGSREARARG